MNDIKNCQISNSTDGQGNPTGGYVYGRGLNIIWQAGPKPEDQEPNGAFVETILAAAIQRLEFYQTAADGKFLSEFNEQAINHIQSALIALEARTADRKERGVKGTHNP